ncbi:MAG: chemotaxis protein CheX [Planctomycetales bacterium]
MPVKSLNQIDVVRELVSPFAKSLQSVLNTMMQVNSQMGEPQLVSQGAHLYAVSSSVGLSGELTGAVTFSTTIPVACKMLEMMTGMEATEPDEFVRDVIGEMANMVAGHGKRELEDYQLRLGLPQVMIGEGMVLYTPRWSTHYWLHLETDLGPCTLDVGFSQTCA